jgi:hypothetical protein
MIIISDEVISTSHILNLRRSCFPERGYPIQSVMLRFLRRTPKTNLNSFKTSSPTIYTHKSVRVPISRAYYKSLSLAGTTYNAGLAGEDRGGARHDCECLSKILSV